MQNSRSQEESTAQSPLIDLVDKVASHLSPGNLLPSDAVLLQVENLSLQTPQYTMILIKDLALTLRDGQSLLVSFYCDERIFCYQVR